MTSLREGGASQAALRYAERPLTLTPVDRDVQRLVEALHVARLAPSKGQTDAHATM